MPDIIYTATPWPTNAHLIADVAKLGYLRKDWLTLDPTYGLGNFWNVWRPDKLVTLDLYTPAAIRADFRRLPFRDNTFKVVVDDGPYKLNGTPTESVDTRYGVGKTMRWQERLHLMLALMQESYRVLARGGYLLFKCQDQVCSGKVRWQTDMFANEGYVLGLEKVDRLDFLNIPRPQNHPQVHSRRNYSTLLVFKKK